MRKFEELTTEIEHNGERFVPIEVIAKLAFCSGEIHLIEPHSIAGFDARFFGRLDINDNLVKLIIQQDFDIIGYCDGVETCIFSSVQIVKNLIEWGFVEP